MMSFNVLEYCRQRNLPLVFSSTREVYGDVHRFEGYSEATADFAFTESPYSASKIASEASSTPTPAATASSTSRSASRTSTGATTTTCTGCLAYSALHPRDVARRADHRLLPRRQGARLHLHRRLRRRNLARDRGACQRTRCERDDQPGFGEGNTLVRAAELIAAELDVEPKMTIAPSLLGEVTRYVADSARRATCSAGSRRSR